RAGGFALPVETVGNGADEGRTHDHALGDAGDRADLSFGLYAEADGDRQVRLRLDPCDMTADLAQIRRFRSGDASDRNEVNEPARVAEHGGQAPSIRRRRGQANEVEARRRRGGAKFGIFLWRHVDHDQTVRSRLDRIGDESIDGIYVYGVVITH